MGDLKRLWGCLGRFLESHKVFRHHSEAGLWRRVGLYRPPSDGLQIQMPPLGQAGVWFLLDYLAKRCDGSQQLGDGFVRLGFV